MPPRSKAEIPKGRRAVSRSEGLLRIHDNGYGAVVHELDLHVRLKDAGFDAHAQPPQAVHDIPRTGGALPRLARRDRSPAGGRGARPRTE